MSEENKHPTSIITQTIERLDLDGKYVETLEKKYIISYEEGTKNNGLNTLGSSDTTCIVVDFIKKNVQVMQNH